MRIVGISVALVALSGCVVADVRTVHGAPAAIQREYASSTAFYSKHIIEAVLFERIMQDEEAGFVDVGLHLRWLELSDDTSAPEPGGNVVRVFYDAETGTVKIVRPDGAVGTIEVSWV